MWRQQPLAVLSQGQLLAQVRCAAACHNDINHRIRIAFRTTFDAVGIKFVSLVGQGGEFRVTAKQAAGTHVTLSLTRQKKEPRRFKDANRAMLLRDIGVHRFDVDLKHWTPKRKGISA